MMISAEVYDSSDDDFRLRKDWKEVTSVFRKGEGELTKLLSEGEFEMFQNAPIFESSFMQVDTFGRSISMIKDPIIVTIGITASHMFHWIPDIMLIAEINPPSTADYPNGSLRLQSLYPLRLVRISVWDKENHIIKLTRTDGREFYLQLYTPDDSGDELFNTWMNLISLLSLQWEKVSVSAYTGSKAILVQKETQTDLQSTADSTEVRAKRQQSKADSTEVRTKRQQKKEPKCNGFWRRYIYNY